MANRDYYNVLGVSRKATQDEIKKAYRTLAMRWHPDRNPGDAESEQRFKDITEAYHVLGDPEQRQRYDRLGPLYNPDGRPPRPEEVNEILGSMLGSLFRRRRKGTGEDDLRYTLSLELEEVARGVEKRIVVPRLVRCTRCSGTGADPDGGRRECEVCDGSGRSTGPRFWRGDCYHCEGRGYTVERPCSACDGEGRLGREDSITVKVPPGVATGQKLRLESKGNDTPGSDGAGDLFVIVNVADHPLFRRRGDDVLVELPLTLGEAALGADVTVPTLDGTTTIRIPAGTPHGKVLRLAGRGLPRVGRPGRGDEHIQVALEVPSDLAESRRAALRAWYDDLPPGAHPRRHAFDQELRKRR